MKIEKELSFLQKNLNLDNNSEKVIEFLQQQLMEQEKRMRLIWRQKPRHT